jgi:hypothetical protein
MAKDKGGDLELKKFNAGKMANQTYKIILYTILTVWGYIVLRKTPHLPGIMGGSGTMKAAYESTMDGHPYIKFDQDMYVWFLYAQGIYWGELVDHVFVAERSTNFDEMLIHHLATVALVGGSSLTNQIGVGAIIAWLHMFTDVFAPMTKLAACTNYDLVAAISFAGGFMPTWFYWRIYCFG